MVWASVAYAPADQNNAEGVYVAVGMYSPSQSHLTMRSTDNAATWITHPAPKGAFITSLTYGKGKFVAVGVAGPKRVIFSTDLGISWSFATSSDEQVAWSSVAYGNNVFVAVGTASDGYLGERTMHSSDGISWIGQASANEAKFWNSVVFGNNVFVAIGSTYMGMTGPNQGVTMTSADGSVWTSHDGDLDDDNDWASVGWIPESTSIFCAVAGYAESGSAYTMASLNNGDTWSSTPQTTIPDPTINTWASVTCNANGTCVAVASNGNQFRTMRSSDNCATWTGQASIAEVNSWSSVSRGAHGTFVAVAGGFTGAAKSRVMRSTDDGLTWVPGYVYPGPDNPPPPESPPPNSTG